MTFTEKLFEWWPIGVLLVGIGFRVENGRLLNKQAVKHIEDQRKADLVQHEKDLEALHSRLSRSERQNGETLKEIRTDIKVLLQR